MDVPASQAGDLADLVKNEPDVEWFRQFYDWLVVGKEPGHTKQELIEFASSYGLEPADIAEAFKAAGLEWDPSPEAWGKLTEAVAQYAEAEEVVPDPVPEY